MDFTNEIVKHVGTYRINMKTGWTGELNMVSWNGRESKLEIREWNPEHDKCGRGMTFTPNEGRRLYELLKDVYGEDEVNDGIC